VLSEMICSADTHDLNLPASEARTIWVIIFCSPVERRRQVAARAGIIGTKGLR
jgi:hypothetical protein